LSVAPAAAQQQILAGLDLLETSSTQTSEDFSSLDLLCPGVTVIGNPIIPLQGVPLGSVPQCPGANLGNTDTIVRRIQSTPVLFPGEQAVVPIEIVALHLVSVEPIRVQTPSGIQNWNVHVSVDQAVQPVGQMTIRKQHPNGGTFDSFLPVRPHFVFTNADNCPPSVTCETDGPVIAFQTFNAPWVHHSNSGEVLEVPGCTTNFVAGVLGPDPLGRDSNVGFSEAALLRAHGVLPPLPPKLTQHSWQEAVHFVFWMENPQTKDAPPQIDALRMFNPRWVPPPPLVGPPDSSIYVKSSSICNLDPIWGPPTSWTRVNWDSLSVLFREEAYWFFPPVPPGGMAPEMDIVFSVLDTTSCYFPPLPGGWYEVDVECFFACVSVDTGTFRFRCDPETGPPVSVPELGVGPEDGPRLLQQNYPNPFRRSAPTTIRYTLERPMDVKLTIYNVQGQVVAVLEEGRREAGSHDVSWDGRDANGTNVAAGTYFYEIQAGGVRDSKKMIRLQ
jgi:hypothetical protein